MAERPQCSTDTGPRHAQYNIPIHVAGLFIILAASLAGAGFPVLAKRYKTLRIPPAIFFACKHFGTGVLTATAFVHLLPTAWGNLLNPCLPDFFTKKYRPLAGLIMMASMFALFVVEMYLNEKTGGHSHGGPTGEAFTSGHHHHHDHAHKDDGKKNNSTAHSFDEKKPNQEPTSRALTTIDSDNNSTKSTTDLPRDAQAAVAAAAAAAAAAATETRYFDESATVTIADTDTVDEHTLRKMSAGVTLLEAGILFHSVFVGMTLSLTTLADGYATLLAALVFHQLFEGLGLGARIAAVPWPSSSPSAAAPSSSSFSLGIPRAWLLVFAFALTAPLGQAVGLAVEGSASAYDPQGALGLVLIGVFNAVSAGLLLYAALVDLLAEDFLSEEAMSLMDCRTRARAFGYVLLGAACMTVVGIFA